MGMGSACVEGAEGHALRKRKQKQYLILTQAFWIVSCFAVGKKEAMKQSLRILPVQLPG